MSTTAMASGSVSASSAIVAPASTATQRSGRTREPTMSESCPTAIRPRAPSTWVTATSAPAAAADQSRSCTSQVSEKVHTRNCGTTSSTETPCTRIRNPSAR